MALLANQLVTMKLTWDRFGFNEPDPKERLQAILGQHLPEELFGTVRVVAMSREPGYAMMFAVETSLGDAAGPISLPLETIRQIQKQYGDKTVHVVRWSDDAESLIRNALYAARVDTVLLYDMIGRAIVLVQDDQLSLAAGPRGQAARLASKLCGWDIEIMTANKLELQVRRAKSDFRELEWIADELAVNLAEQGFLSYDDLSVIDPHALMRIGNLRAEQAEAIVRQAEAKAEEDSQ